MELWEIDAHVQIRNLVATYNANGDSGRFDEMVQVFSPDGVLEAGGGTHRGRDAIIRFLTGVADGPAATPSAAPPPRSYVRHMVATHKIDVLSADEATGYAYYQVITKIGLDHWGRYFDRYENVDGTWLIAHRRATTDGAVEGSWSHGRAGSPDPQE
ncbi:MAG: nuclear transport factor 2 family protein [Acidimicrobiia bacterium]